jgi:hypothetical protein
LANGFIIQCVNESIHILLYPSKALGLYREPLKGQKDYLPALVTLFYPLRKSPTPKVAKWFHVHPLLSGTTREKSSEFNHINCKAAVRASVQYMPV